MSDQEGPGTTPLGQAGQRAVHPAGTGIISYGVNIPRYRIETSEIARVWGADPDRAAKGLNVQEKSVPSPDEDVCTISVEAARMAIERAPHVRARLGAIYVGSESHPYAVKPTAGMVAEALQVTPALMAADYEFACKAGTAAIQNGMGLVGSGLVDYSMAIGADTSQGAPGDALEYSASAGGAAIVVGPADESIATFNATASFTTDTPDFWRREGEKYPTHAGRFTGEPAYFRHVVACAEQIFDKMGTGPDDYDFAVFHQPNGKFPIKVARHLGFSEKQYETGLLCPRIGNTYSGASLIGLAAILDIARPGDRIFCISYGSGAGSDGFDLTVTEANADARDRRPHVEDLIADKAYIDYATYVKYRGKLHMGAIA